MLVANLVFWPAVAFLAGCNLYFGPRIRSGHMAMQWGLDGEPTWYAPKVVGLWGMVGVRPCGAIADLGCLNLRPGEGSRREIGLLLFSVIVAAVHVLTLRKADRAN
jgi:hypothetical protein